MRAAHGHGVVHLRENYYCLGLSLTSRCQLRCVHCYYQGWRAEGGDLPLDRLRRILAELPPLASVNIGMEGEPLLYPWLGEALALLADKAQFISLVSNGQLLTRDKVAQMKESALAQLVLSTEGATASGYERWRRGGSFGAVRENVGLAARELSGRVTLHATVFAQNLEDLTQLPRLAENLGIGRISLQQFRPPPTAGNCGLAPAPPEDLLRGLEQMLAEAEKFQIAVAFDAYFGDAEVMAHLRNLPWAQVIGGTSLPAICPFPSRWTSLLADGSLFPCCGDFVPQPVSHYSFEGIFNHPFLRALRRQLEGSSPPLQCRRCHYGAGQRTSAQ